MWHISGVPYLIGHTITVIAPLFYTQSAICAVPSAFTICVYFFCVVCFFFFFW